MANRRQFILAAGTTVVGLQGCSFKQAFEGEAIDLRGYNLINEDNADLAGGDAATAAGPPDLTSAVPKDLGGNDLADDLAHGPPDMATAPPKDLISAPPDMVCSGNLTVTTANSLPVGGAMLIQDRTLVIIARDARGFMAMSSACTHAGCPVRVNSGAQSYDCPCHGSRFHLDGSVLQGPAQTPLQHLPLCRADSTTLLVDQYTYLKGIDERVT